VCADRLPLLYTETKLTNDPNWSSIVPICDLYGAWFQPTFIDTDTRFVVAVFFSLFSIAILVVRTGHTATKYDCDFVPFDKLIQAL